MRNEQKQAGYAFGPFRLDMRHRRLLRAGAVVPLQPKDFETLLVLVQHCAQVVAKEELMTRLWPDTIVEEANLCQHIYVLRKVLGEGTHDHPYIVTVPGRGYRFVAAVTAWSETSREDGEIGSEGKREGFTLSLSRRAVATGVMLLGVMAVLVWWWMMRRR